jgi:hypothetical protein
MVDELELPTRFILPIARRRGTFVSNELNDACRVSHYDSILRYIVDYNASRADLGSTVNGNSSEDDTIGSHVYSIAENWRRTV